MRAYMPADMLLALHHNIVPSIVFKIIIENLLVLRSRIKDINTQRMKPGIIYEARERCNRASVALHPCNPVTKSRLSRVLLNKP